MHPPPAIITLHLTYCIKRRKATHWTVAYCTYDQGALEGVAESGILGARLLPSALIRSSAITCCSSLSLSLPPRTLLLSASLRDVAPHQGPRKRETKEGWLGNGTAFSFSFPNQPPAVRCAISRSQGLTSLAFKHGKPERNFRREGLF